MAKRPAVPAALHAELTEYSSLLRALRANDTLDLATHLLRAPPLASQSSQTFVDDDISLIDDDEATTVAPPLTASGSRDALSEIASSSTRSRLQNRIPGRIKEKGKGKERDTWTRWPLLAGDVHVPEWGLVDEVKHALEQVLQRSCGHNLALHHEDDETEPDAVDPDVGTDDTSFPDDEDRHPALSPSALQALTSDSAAFLTRILALLTAHVPTAEKSMQNRVRPISWETVVDVACTNGAITTQYVLPFGCCCICS